MIYAIVFSLFSAGSGPDMGLPPFGNTPPTCPQTHYACGSVCCPR